MIGVVGRMMMFMSLTYHHYICLFMCTDISKAQKVWRTERKKFIGHHHPIGPLAPEGQRVRGAISIFVQKGNKMGPGRASGSMTSEDEEDEGKGTGTRGQQTRKGPNRLHNAG